MRIGWTLLRRRTCTMETKALQLQLTPMTDLNNRNTMEEFK